MGEPFFARWQRLAIEPNDAAPRDDRHAGKRGWRDVALVLARELHTPMPQIMAMTLVEAAAWMETIHRQPRYTPTDPS